MTQIIRFPAFLFMLIAVSACTRMPVEYRQETGMPAVSITDSQMLQIVATAEIGNLTTYTDPMTGLSSEIVVESEYFSANGRLCRRFTERQSAAASSYSRLSCNGSNGWVEIPIASFSG